MAKTEANEAVAKLRKLIEKIQVGMLTTIEADGSLRSRPMASQQTETDGDLWFFTRRESAKTDELAKEHHVNVSFSEPKSQTYVSVSGMAEVLQDKAKAKELWNPILKAWFPKGLDDPELALIRVRVDKAEYWDAPSSAMVHIVGFVKAIATGKPYRPGENKKLDLN